MQQHIVTWSKRILVAGVCMFVFNAAQSEAAKIRVRLMTLAPRGTSAHKSLQRMAQEWKEISNGKVELIIYAGGIQGGEAAMVDRMRIHQCQAGLLTAVGLTEIEPAVAGLQSMPMMFRNLNEVDYIGEKLQPMLEKRLLEKDFVVLQWVDAGWVRFFSNKPVITPDDLRELKLFVWEGDPDGVVLWKAAGFDPVPLETGVILPGLQTGLIDAVPMPPFFALASQVYRPASHMLDLNWAPLVGAAVITRKAWDTIPAELHADLLESAQKIGDEIKANARKDSEESVQIMAEKWGLTVHPVTTAIQEEWRKGVAPSYREIRGKIVPEEIFDRVQELLQDYRMQQADVR